MHALFVTATIDADRNEGEGLRFLEDAEARGTATDHDHVIAVHGCLLPSNVVQKYVATDLR